MVSIVERFAIELGLDPTPYTKGRKEIAEQQRKLREDTLKTATSIEEAGRKSAESMRKLARELLALFAVFTGTRSLGSFVTDMTKVNAELGRFSYNLNQSPQTIAAWGAAAERLGGSAQATAASFENVSKALYDLNRNGQLLPKEFTQLMGASHRNIRTDQGADTYFKDVAGALKEVAKIDPARAHFLARGLGIDDGTANVMIKYGDAVGRYIKSLERLSPDNAAIRASQKLQDSWERLEQTAIKLGTVILTQVQPYITQVVDSMSDWIDKNGEWVSSGVTAAVQSFVGWVKEIDWDKFRGGLDGVASDAAKAAGAITSIAAAVSDVIEQIGILTGTPSQAENDASSMRARGANMTGGMGPSVRGWRHQGERRDPDLLNMDVLQEWMYPDGSRGKARTGGSGYGNAGAGARGRGGLDLDDGGRSASLDAFLGETKVDGKPVSKGNPMPVVVTQSGDGGGGGIWGALGNLWDATKRAMTSFGVGPAGSGSMLSSSGSGDEDFGVSGDKPVSEKVKGSAKAMMDRLIQKHGWTPAAAAIAAAQANAESSFRTDARNPNDAGPGKDSWGLFQWNRARLAAMQKFVGSDWKKDFLGQVDFFAKEAASMIPSWPGQQDVSNAGRIGKSFEGYKGPIQKARNDNAYRYWKGYTPPMGLGGGISGNAGITTGAAGSAALSTIANTSHVTTSSTSNAMHVNKIEVNAPRATDATGIARKMRDALDRTWASGSVNYGMK